MTMLTKLSETGANIMVPCRRNKIVRFSFRLKTAQTKGCAKRSVWTCLKIRVRAVLGKETVRSVRALVQNFVSSRH